MRATVTVDDELFAEADRRAAELGVSRSGFYQRALEHYLERLRAAALTDRMNRFLERYGDGIDSDFASHVAEVWSRDMGDDEW
jgi:metal-responsive CopG/Arc/MetJ family transcriptional regulator